MDLTPLILNPNSFDLDALPPELIYQICSQMSTENLQNMVKTSHKVHDICDDILKTREPVWLDPEYRKLHKITGKELRELNNNYGTVMIVDDECSGLINLFRQPLTDRRGNMVYFLGLGRGVGSIDCMKKFLTIYYRQHRIKRVNDDPLWFDVMYNQPNQFLDEGIKRVQNSIDNIDEVDPDIRNELLEALLEDIQILNNRKPNNISRLYFDDITVEKEIDHLIATCTEKAFIRDLLIIEELQLIKEDIAKMETIYRPEKRLRK